MSQSCCQISQSHYPVACGLIRKFYDDNDVVFTELSTLQVRNKGDLHGPKLFQASNEGIKFLVPKGWSGGMHPPKTLKISEWLYNFISRYV